MRRPGWNPARRNRNIGTAKSGHGRHNRLVIPERLWDERAFYVQLRHPVFVTDPADGRGLVVVVEPVISGYTHCCTPDDVLAVVDMVPPEDLEGLRVFVLRQPTRKQAVVQPVWGRMAHWADLGRLSGPAVIIEAQELGRTRREKASMPVDWRREFDRLIADGHRPQEIPTGYRWEKTLEASRSTQLYRTLLHEVGHHVDCLRSLERPQAELDPMDAEWDALLQRWLAKPTREREDFAHRYAGEVGERLRAAGKLPFERLADPHRLRDQGLDPAWFGLPSEQPSEPARATR